jgi:hypothetical protein
MGRPKIVISKNGGPLEIELVRLKPHDAYSEVHFWNLHGSLEPQQGGDSSIPQMPHTRLLPLRVFGLSEGEYQLDLESTFYPPIRKNQTRYEIKLKIRQGSDERGEFLFKGNWDRELLMARDWIDITVI